MFITKNNPIDLLSEDEARALLEKHLKELRQCISDAWAAWVLLGSRAPEFRVDLDAVARAACLSSHIRARVRECFQGREAEGIFIREKGRLFLLDICGKVLIRFKKLSIDLISSNVMTRQQMQLKFQLSLPGFPEATHLTCGYVLDALQTSIDQMVVTCRIGSSLRYKIDLDGADNVEILVPTGAPSSETRPKVTPAVPVRKEEQDSK